MSESQEDRYPFVQPAETQPGSLRGCAGNSLEPPAPVRVHYFTPLDEVRTRRYLDPQTETLLGFPPSEWFDPGFWLDRLHPEDRERVLVEIDQCFGQGNRFKSKYRLVARNGHAVWFQDEGIVRGDKRQRLRFLEGMLSAMTEQNR